MFTLLAITIVIAATLIVFAIANLNGANDVNEEYYDESIGTIAGNGIGERYR